MERFGLKVDRLTGAVNPHAGTSSSNLDSSDRRVVPVAPGRIAADLYRDGERVHRYVSEIAMTGSPFQHEDGSFTVEIEGTYYAEDDPDYPQGPRGTEPAWLVPFGVGEIDTARLAGLLEGTPDPGAATSNRPGRPRRLYAEQQHWAILEELHLDPRPLADQFE